MPTTRWHWRVGVDLLQLKRTTAALLALRGQLRAEGLTPKLAPAGGVTRARRGRPRDPRHRFPLQAEPLPDADAALHQHRRHGGSVARSTDADAPARHGALGESRAEGVVTRTGRTRHLPPSSGGASPDTPPEGEKERLIWAMEQCG